MTLSTITRWIAAAVAAAALAACGGGGASGGIDGTGGGGNNGGGVGGITGGIDGTGMSYGTITAFGSVWVNGVEFSTGSSKYVFDDRSGISQSDLRVGMVVRVDGSIENKTANLIIVDDSIKGYVESVATDGTGIVVMGQRVLYDAKTSFGNGRPTGGDYVEVHGLPGEAGTVTAGYVEKKTTLATPPFEVKGLVANHDTAGKTFTIGALTVSYGSATVDDSLPAGSWNGMLIEAKGSNCAANPTCGTLTASKVERSGLKLSPSVNVAKAEVEGIVVSGNSASFVIGGQTVATTGSTVFERGLPEDVIPGAKLEAEGPIANGVLTAVKVSFRDSIKLEGDTASVNAAGNTFAVAGLPGVVVRTNAQTRWKSDAASIAALASGTFHVRVKARPGPAGEAVALEVDARNRSDSRTEIEGPVTAVNGTTSLTILGVSVDNGQASEFRNLDDSPMTRDAFYAVATVGKLVKARGDLAGASVGWKQMELED